MPTGPFRKPWPQAPCRLKCANCGIAWRAMVSKFTFSIGAPLTRESGKCRIAFCNCACWKTHSTSMETRESWSC